MGTNPIEPDTDNDGLTDGQEDLNKNGIWDEGLETNPLDSDTDGDEATDGQEQNSLGSDPLDPDTDEDGIEDGREVELMLLVGHHCLSPILPDSDFDGLTDKEEIDGAQGGLYPSFPCASDSDNDNIYDLIETHYTTEPPMDPLQIDWDPLTHPDQDGDGLLDSYELMLGTDERNADTDQDNLDDDEEHFMLTDHFITDPLDGDHDNDGILDGNEGGILENGVVVPGPDPSLPGTDPTDADTDDDGIDDGIEAGLSEVQLAILIDEFGQPYTVDYTGPRLMDEDPIHNTDPLDDDTDDDGLKDGDEDVNKNGLQEPVETDPLKEDSDGDLLSDGWETQYNIFNALCAGGWLSPINPDDADLDPDNDGLTNKEEHDVFKVEDAQIIPILLIRVLTTPTQTD